MYLVDLFTDDMTPDWEVFERTFPEMATCNHSERWHKEGSPLEHTKLVTKEMYNRIKKFNFDSNPNESAHYLIMMSAAMLHDIGKPKTTTWSSEKEDWTCKKHGEAGEKLFREIFMEERMDIRENVAYMIRNHMTLHHITDKDEERKKNEFSNLINGTVPFEDMLLLNECDMRGSISGENDDVTVTNRMSLLTEEMEKVKANPTNNKWRNINDNSRKAYVMIGIPGCGKSTFSEDLRKVYAEKGLELPIISRDTIRVELGYCKEGEKFLGNKKQENKVTKVFDEKIRSQVGDFIIDNTSLKAKYRNEYNEYFFNCDISPIYVYIEAPSIKDNIARRCGQINEDVIKRMWNDLEFPSRSECYELWLISQRENKTYKL